MGDGGEDGCRGQWQCSRAMVMRVAVGGGGGGGGGVGGVGLDVGNGGGILSFLRLRTLSRLWYCLPGWNVFLARR